MSKRRTEPRPPGGRRAGPPALSRAGRESESPAARGGPRPTAVGPADRPAWLSYRFRSLAMPYLMAILAAFLLSLAFPPLDLSWFAYLGPAPLLMMAKATRSPRQVFRAAWVGGLVFFGVNLYWVLPLTWLGWAALIVYLGAYWALFAWSLRRIGDAARLPATILAPVLWVALEFVRGWLLTGLPWLYAAHSQYANLTLIQTADLVGAYGPSFLILMTAGLGADLLSRPIFVASLSRAPKASADAGASAAPRGPFSRDPKASARRLSPVLLGMVLLTAAAWAGTVAYGKWRLGQQTVRPGPAVGTVQTCVPQAVKQEARLTGKKSAAEEMLDDQVLRTRQVVGEARQGGLKLDLVVWPETMAPGILNPEFLEDAALESRIEGDVQREFARLVQEESRAYWLQIAEASQKAEAPILFGANAGRIEGIDRLPFNRFMTRGPRWNSALLMTPACAPKPYSIAHTYSKVHLVPFGEFVPFKTSWPWLHGQLMALTPYDYDYTVVPGDPDQTPFTIAYDLPREGGAAARQGTANFQVAICYEDAMAYRIRDMARPRGPGETKAVDFLVNISNDGWFNGSIELDQHLNLCAFRAVENRIPVVRSVNTGISAIIASDGRIVKVVEDIHGRRRYIAGQTFGRLMLDDRVAPYTWMGDVFAKTCVAGWLAGLGLVLVRGRMARKEGRS